MARFNTTSSHTNAAWTFMWAMTAELLIIVMFRGLFMVREPLMIDPTIHAEVRHQLQQARDEGGKWLTQFKQANAERGTLLQNVEALIAQLAKQTTEATEAEGRWQIERASFEAQQREQAAYLADTKMQLDAASFEMCQLEALLAETRQSIADARDAYQRELVRRDALESGLRRDLIGLKGDFRRVVFVIDRSGSMAAVVRGVSRWDHTIHVVEQWLRYLPVEQAALVTFSDDVKTSGAMITINQPRDRDGLLAFLAGLKPDGYTDTVSALKASYAYRPTTIVLFTDGTPLLPGKSSPELRRQVIDFVKAQASLGQTPTINAIALGDYFNSPDMSQFLMELAEQTGGAFLGR